MTERTEALTQASAPTFAHEGSYVDWSAILAGAVVASGIAFVFSTFGAALGLSLISPYDGDGSATAAIVAVALWMLWTTASSFMVGGYIAGRMRRRVDAANADEVGVRDGIHGLAVWGAAVLLGAFVFTSGLDTVVQAGAKAAAPVAETVRQVADGATDPANTAAATADAANQENATPVAEPAMTEAEAEEAAETARIYSVFSAFALAAALFVAAAGSYWAASMGGRHRDEGRAFTRFGNWT